MRGKDFINKFLSVCRKRTEGAKFKSYEEINALCKKYRSMDEQNYPELLTAIDDLSNLVLILNRYIMGRADDMTVLNGMSDVYIALHKIEIALDISTEHVENAVEVKAEELESLIKYYKAMSEFAGNSEEEENHG